MPYKVWKVYLKVLLVYNKIPKVVLNYPFNDYINQIGN